MRQGKHFQNPVYKGELTNEIIGVGDPLKFKLKDDTYVTVTVTGVEDGGRWIEWDHVATATRKEDVNAVAAAHEWSCFYYGGAANPEGEDPIVWP